MKDVSGAEFALESQSAKLQKVMQDAKGYFQEQAPSGQSLIKIQSAKWREKFVQNSRQTKHFDL